MYVNHGNKDFFEHGRLVDAEHEENVIHILCCEPYQDEEDKFQFGECTVDVTDSWINRKSVMRFIGMSEEAYDPVEFALGCVDYYSWDNFGAMDYGCSYNWQDVDRETIIKELKRYMIACDGLDTPGFIQDSALVR